MYRRNRIGDLAALICCAATLLPAISPAAGGLAPHRIERLQPILTRHVKGGGASLEFSAYGRGFRLELAANPRLSAVATGAAVQLYAGSIEGVPGSWARISVSDGRPSGMVWDGHDLLIVESPPWVAGETEAAGTVMFKLADSVLEQPISFAGDTVDAPRDATGEYRALVDELRVAALQASVATDRLEVSLLGDAAFAARYADEAQARDAMLVRLNNVDGIFSSQVGVELHVASVNLADAVSGNLSATTNPSTLLDELGVLRQQTAALNATGLTHLFTGRNLDGDTAGVAYTQALCSRRFGASLAMGHTSAALDTLITAHEIGHVFGAPHDGTEECAATPQNQFIMSPSVSTGVSSFSQCSLDMMRPEIDSGSCLTALAAVDLTLPASLGSKTVVAGSDVTWEVSIANQGGRAASGARATLQVTPALTITSASTAGGNCLIQASLATCDLPVIAAAAAQVIQLTMRSAAAGTYTLQAQVVVGDDGNAADNSGEGTLTVSAAVATPAPPAPTPSGGGGGGGGALDAFTLLLLAGVLAARLWWSLAPGRRRRAQSH